MADNERVYIIDGKEYPSVTTILGAVVAKQMFLIPWALNGQFDRIVEWLQANPDADPATFVAAKEDIAASRERVGFQPARIGDVVHDIIHQSIKSPDLFEKSVHTLETVYNHDMEDPGWNPDLRFHTELAEMFSNHELDITEFVTERSGFGTGHINALYVLNCLKAWKQWCADFSICAGGEPSDTDRFEVTESEKLVYDMDEHKYAGTVDLVLTDLKYPLRQYIIDIKTGSENKDHLYQVAAYSHAFNTMSWHQNQAATAARVTRCFMLYLDRNLWEGGNPYKIRESRSWEKLYETGFAPALEWWLTFKANTPGRQVKPDDFLKETT
jgi:hypothetical protein